MKKGIVWGAVVAVAALVLAYGFLIKNKETEQGSSQSLKIGGVVLNIEVANTDAEREQGLSGRVAKESNPLGLALGENEGMLFVFEKEGYYGFWMKDMNFPIDIAWLDKNKKIIHIEKNVLPETYPNVFSPSAPSLYVLETNANFFENHQIKIGATAEF